MEVSSSWTFTTVREYHFQNGEYEYVSNTASQRLQIMYTDPEMKKVEVVRSYSGSDHKNQPSDNQ